MLIHLLVCYTIVEKESKQFRRFIAYSAILDPYAQQLVTYAKSHGIYLVTNWKFDWSESVLFPGNAIIQTSWLFVVDFL